MTNSERAAADQRLMDAMRDAGGGAEVYTGRHVWAVRGYGAIRTYGDFDILSLPQARALHRELGEALAAIEAQFGEKPVAVSPENEKNARSFAKQILQASYNGPPALFDTEGVYVEKPQSITVLQIPEDAPGTRETIWGSWSDTRQPVPK